MPRKAVSAVLLSLACAVAAQPAAAQSAPVQATDEPAQLQQPLPPAEETPGFQAVRPLPAAEAPAAPAPATSAPVAATAPAPAAPPTIVAAPPPPPPPQGGGLPSPSLLIQGGMAALMVGMGGLVAGLAGSATAAASRRAEDGGRRRSAAAALAVELEARLQAFEAVPVPPNAEAGVSFVSAVTALADLDCAWRSAQTGLHLLPDRLAAPLAVHYGAVHHVARFVKALSFAAGLRMLQANRIGGHPCPDAGTMREAHVELAAAFRGVDKIVMGLKAIA